MASQAATYTGTSATTSQASFLRNALRGNAIFSTLSGLLFTFASFDVATYSGIQDATILNLVNGTTFISVLGIGLIFFGILVFATSMKKNLTRQDGYAIIIADVLWVIVSAIVLITGVLSFNTEGNWGTLIIADIVGLFAILQYIGVRRMKVS